MQKTKIFFFSLLTFCMLPVAEAYTSLRPAVRGCPSSGYKRLVNVSTQAQLVSALSNAQPGDQIRLAAGSYVGEKKIYDSGTASDPIVICGVRGVWPKLYGGTFGLKGNYIVVSGLAFDGPNNGNNIWSYMVHDIQFTYNIIANGDSNGGLSMAGTYNFEISHNLIHDNGYANTDHGLYLQSTPGPVIVANNVIYGNAGRGISMHSNSEGAINRITVVNNTIVGNGSTGILFTPNAGTSNVIANNIVSNNGNVFRYKQIRVKSGTGNIVRNNIVWSPDSSLQGIETDTDVYNTVISGNVIADPAFYNFSADDFHLREGSPAISLGIAAYATINDVEDKTRDLTPDAGAYEAASVAPPPPTEPPPTEPTPTSPPPPPSTNKVVTFNAVADAGVNANYPTTNFGKATTFMVDLDYNKIGYVQFSVANLAAQPVKAVIRVYVSDGSNDAPKVVQVSNSWSELTVNYNNRPSIISGTLQDKALVNGGNYTEYDVTAAVKSNGLISFGFIPTSKDGMKIRTRESTAPQLILTLP
jgi:hypothetical protein